MFPRELSTFHTVVKAGSIRKASDQIGVAPSSISRKIAVFERQIGTTLFERSPLGLTLTHAGRLVADYVSTVVRDYESLRADLDDSRGFRRRLIHLAAVESFAVNRFIDAINNFSARYEGVSFKITVVPAPRVSEIVSRGECCIGLTFCSAPDPRFTVLERVSEPIVVAARPDHPIAKFDMVPLREIEKHSIALPDGDFHVRALFNQACYAAGCEIPVRLTANTFESLRDFVRSGAGIAVLPRGAIAREIRQRELAAIPIEVPSLSETTIDVIIRRGRIPRVVSLFVDELRHVIAGQ